MNIEKILKRIVHRSGKCANEDFRKKVCNTNKCPIYNELHPTPIPINTPTGWYNKVHYRCHSHEKILQAAKEILQSKEKLKWLETL